MEFLEDIPCNINNSWKIRGTPWRVTFLKMIKQKYQWISWTRAATNTAYTFQPSLCSDVEAKPHGLNFVCWKEIDPLILVFIMSILHRCLAVGGAYWFTTQVHLKDSPPTLVLQAMELLSGSETPYIISCPPIDQLLLLCWLPPLNSAHWPRFPCQGTPCRPSIGGLRARCHFKK